MGPRARRPAVAPARPNVAVRPIQAAVASPAAAPDSVLMAVPVAAVAKAPTRVHVRAGAPIDIPKAGRDPMNARLRLGSSFSAWVESMGWYHPRNVAGNPDSRQAVTFSTSFIAVLLVV